MIFYINIVTLGLPSRKAKIHRPPGASRTLASLPWLASSPIGQVIEWTAYEIKQGPCKASKRAGNGLGVVYKGDRELVGGMEHKVLSFVFLWLPNVSFNH